VERMNHRMEILGGIRAEECGRVLKKFFEAKRVGIKPAP